MSNKGSTQRAALSRNFAEFYLCVVASFIHCKKVIILSSALLITSYYGHYHSSRMLLCVCVYVCHTSYEPINRVHMNIVHKCTQTNITAQYRNKNTERTLALSHFGYKFDFQRIKQHWQIQQRLNIEPRSPASRASTQLITLAIHRKYMDKHTSDIVSFRTAN